MKDPAKGLSIRAYAEHRRLHGLKGHTPLAVQKALKSGRIKKNEHGKITPAEADASWERQTSPSRRAATETFADERPSGRSSGVDYAEARAVREVFAARLARLEFEVKNASLVSADQIKVEIFKKARQVRDRMLAIPGRVGAQLAAEADTRVIRRILEQEIRKALEALGDE